MLVLLVFHTVILSDCFVDVPGFTKMAVLFGLEVTGNKKKSLQIAA